MVLNTTSNEIRILRELRNTSGVPRKELLERLSMNPSTFQYTISKLNGFITLTKKEKESPGRKPFVYSLTEAGLHQLKAIELR